MIDVRSGGIGIMLICMDSRDESRIAEVRLISRIYGVLTDTAFVEMYIARGRLVHPVSYCIQLSEYSLLNQA